VLRAAGDPMEPITAIETSYQAEPGAPWAPGLPRRFVGVGQATAWTALPTVAALEAAYGACVERGADAEGRQTLTFHRVGDGAVTVLTYDGPPLT
jgi:hypothetical protein